MSKTEKILFKILAILAIIWVVVFIFTLVYVPHKLRNRVEPQKFPYIYVSSFPEMHLLWNPSELVYTGVVEISGKKEEFVLTHHHDKIYAFSTSHFAHICHPELFRSDDCKCMPLFEGESSYHTKDFSVKVTEDAAGVFAGELPVLIFTRHDIMKYRDGTFANNIGFEFQYWDAIDASDTYGIALVRDDVEGVYVGTCERNEENVDFVLLEKEDSFYALPISHLAHMAHTSLFAEDECIKAPLFEGKTVYGNGLTELHITKDQSGIFGRDLPQITLSRFDKSEYFGEEQ